MPKVMTIDLETTGLDPWHDKILLIAYRYNNEGPAQQIKIYDNEQPSQEFIDFLANDTITKRGHNVRFDLLCLIANGYTVRGTIDDTRVLAYLEEPSQEIDLKGLIERKFKRKVSRLEDFGTNRLKKRAEKDHPFLTSKLIKCANVWVSKKTLEEYNKQDVVYCDNLKQELVETKWYKDTEQPLSQILFDAEVRGIQLDIPHFQRLKNEFQENIEELKKSLNAGDAFNPNSPLQVKEEFKKQGISLDTTDKHKLKQLSWFGNQFAKRLLEFRGFSKLLSTYIEPFIKDSDKQGRLHGRFNQAGRESVSLGDIKGTATGRLSSSEPNLQNIPSRTEEGRKIRKGFIASNGFALIDSDLKQIEPRLVAHYSQSKVLLNAYEKGLDTHAIMGGLIFNKQPENLTKLERFIGKTSWLATVYGCSYKKLKTIVEINSEEPIFYDEEFYQKVQNTFWQNNPEIRSWREQLINTTRNTGFIETFGGRTIKIQNINSRNQWERFNGERLAVNYQIQASAADIMKMIMVAWNMHKDPTTHLLAVIHDEILAEAPAHNLECEVEINASCLNYDMCNTVKLKNVPIEADTKIIPNWEEK